MKIMQFGRKIWKPKYRLAERIIFCPPLDLGADKIQHYISPYKLTTPPTQCPPCVVAGSYKRLQNSLAFKYTDLFGWRWSAWTRTRWCRTTPEWSSSSSLSPSSSGCMLDTTLSSNWWLSCDKFICDGAKNF